VGKSVDGFFAKVYGRPAWRAQVGYGKFLTFEFGNPHLEISGPHKPPRNASLTTPQ
jgi:hypothetical protein